MYAAGYEQAPEPAGSAGKTRQLKEHMAVDTGVEEEDLGVALQLEEEGAFADMKDTTAAGTAGRRRQGEYGR